MQGRSDVGVGCGCAGLGLPLWEMIHMPGVAQGLDD